MPPEEPRHAMAAALVASVADAVALINLDHRKCIYMFGGNLRFVTLCSLGNQTVPALKPRVALPRKYSAPPLRSLHCGGLPARISAASACDFTVASAADRLRPVPLE